MPLQRYAIEQLHGVMLNPVDGVHDAPTELENISFDRMAGYTPYGVAGSAVTLTAFDKLRHDQSGIISGVILGNYHLLGPTGTASSSTVARNAAEEAHVDGAGIFARSQIVNTSGTITQSEVFAFYDRGNNLITTAPALGAGEEPVAGTSGTLTEGFYFIKTQTYFLTPAGKMAVRERAMAAPKHITFASGTTNGSIEVSVGALPNNCFVEVYIEKSAILGGDFVPFTSGNGKLAGVLTSGGSLTIKHMPITPGGDNKPMTFGSLITATHNMRTWGLGAYERLGRLIYSDIGWVNVAHWTNELVIQPRASRAITALVSSPAGLLVFFENETYLVQGDPSGSDFSVNPFPTMLGCDENTIPARLGSVMFVIWKGKLYAFSVGGGDVDFGGSLENIGAPLWTPETQFTQVVADAARKHVIAYTSADKAYAYDPAAKKWSNLGTDLTGLDAGSMVLPGCGGSSFRARFLNSTFSVRHIEPASPGSPTAVIKWTDLDMGHINRLKRWHRLMIPYEGMVTTTPLPTLAYSTPGGLSGTITGRFAKNWLVFDFPAGVLGEKITLTVTLPKLVAGCYVGPGVVIDYDLRNGIKI